MQSRQESEMRSNDVLPKTLDRRRILRRGAAVALALPGVAALLSQHASAQTAAVPPDPPRRPQFRLPSRSAG